jgi:hypothetical protein
VFLPWYTILLFASIHISFLLLFAGKMQLVLALEEISWIKINVLKISSVNKKICEQFNLLGLLLLNCLSSYAIFGLE